MADFFARLDEEFGLVWCVSSGSIVWTVLTRTRLSVRSAVDGPNWAWRSQQTTSIGINPTCWNCPVIDSSNLNCSNYKGIINFKSSIIPLDPLIRVLTITKRWYHIRRKTQFNGLGWPVINRYQYNGRHLYLDVCKQILSRINEKGDLRFNSVLTRCEVFVTKFTTFAFCVKHIFVCCQNRIRFEKNNWSEFRLLYYIAFINFLSKQ